ncbi:MAG: flagellar biosynthesis protein FlhF [Oligoflexia bacterium]|nr:flagellar biosynthesis protein FlhF [Oligoflexia bacterium]
MQVKKFEAKSMKEALQLVKQELGPEAIILNAKDNKKFGLAGRGSVEITAAISEKALQKRQYAESRIPEESRERFRAKSAKHQKTFIDTTVNKYHQRQSAIATRSAGDLDQISLSTQAARIKIPTKRGPTSAKYIDIQDEEAFEQPISGRRVDDILEDFARTGSYVLEDAANKAQIRVGPVTKTYQASSHTSTDEVTTLRNEVDSLRELLGQMQNGSSKPRTQHPGAEYGLPFELAANFEKLQTAGIDSRYIVEILEKADKELTGLEKKKRSLIDAWVARYIMSHTHVVGSWQRQSELSQLHLFVGPGGHGKTTALVKIASQLVMHEKKKVAIFTADTFKVGAADQLKIYSQILNIPFETVKHAMEFPRLLQRYAGYDMILIDYPGFSLKDIREIDQIRTLMPPRDMVRVTHLVMSCTAKDIDAYEICNRYQVTQFDDILPTKIDESYTHGFLYNIQRKTEKPLYAFGIGSKIPEDIELATRERVLDLIYKITKRNV